MKQKSLSDLRSVQNSNAKRAPRRIYECRTWRYVKKPLGFRGLIMNAEFRGHSPHKWSWFCRFGAPLLEADVFLYEINTMGFYSNNADIHQTITTNQQVTLKRSIFTSTPFNKLFFKLKCVCMSHCNFYPRPFELITYQILGI
jgi:hypothetical protein